ncbi:AMP-binding protein [Methylobacterium durans]|uniref:AMP-binding protein n=1 Tax=Methylobacterium durans TaxID=2202825 RepID=UPI002AFF2284|nr:AMP-binding protein [Methylobacterium durans]MEA1834386.1 AMP-binding protein [Methylobacterium durans]
MENAVLSHVVGARDEALLEITIGEALDGAAAKWSDRPALIDRGQDVRMSWGGLRRRSDAVAAGLIALGLAPGDRIGIWSLNRYEWTLVQFAAAKAGLILVTINPAYRVAELEFALGNSGCSALVFAPSFKTSDYCAMIREVAPELDAAADRQLHAARLPRLRRVIQLGFDPMAGAIGFLELEALGALAGPKAVDALAASLDRNDPVNIQYTSGTTGAPKGVTLSHRNILNNGALVGRAMRLDHEDRICIPVPLYHCFGLVMGNLACLTSGAAMVYPGEGFDPLRTLQAVAEERCTTLYGVPTMFIAALEHVDRAKLDLTCLRTGIMAGSPCPIAVMKQVVERMHMSDVTIAYGMTETSPVSFQSGIADSLARRVSTVGRVHPHLEVKIVDADGSTIPRGVPGELCTRGYSVMLGYWNDPDQTAAVKDADGWMHSGDLAVLDEEGFCNIVGRIKDMVIRGGENVYPREIEEFLYRHPAIREVQVFGVPDDRLGEELCAWVILHSGASLTAEELHLFCKDKIAHQKVPRHIRFVEAFPLTATGKAQKFVMRDLMATELRVAAPETA